MKKKSFFAMIIGLFLFLPAMTVNAELVEGTIGATAGVTVRSKAGASGNAVVTLKLNTAITIDTEKTKQTEDSSTSCSTGVWYYLTKPSAGYVCSAYAYMKKPTVSITKEQMAAFTDDEFIAYLKSEGFPETYHSKLLAIHKNYPYWIFKGIHTFREWDYILDTESVLGTSLYYMNQSRVDLGQEAYLSTSSGSYVWETDLFYPLDASSWYAANKQTVGYFLDPRNGITESSIFMFEDLGYNPTHTKEDVEKVLSSKYTDYILKAAKEANVSALFLATRIRQEGVLSTNATKGGEFKCDGKTYKGYYNFYNIGATSSKDPVTNGLCYAKAKGWNTPEKAIVEGAKIIAQNYIADGQYTLYFQKWNTSPVSSNAITHQYMTNIEAPNSESSIAYESYKKMGLITKDSSFTFYIPYYYDMPEKTTLPALGNPNNYLKALNVDGVSVPNFKGATTNYNITVDSTKTSVKITCTSVSKKSTVQGCNQSINLTDKVTKATITVTSQTKVAKTYTINITKNDPITSPEPDEKETRPDIDYPSVSQVVKQANMKEQSNYLSGIAKTTSANKLKSSLLTASDTAQVTITDKNKKAKTTAALATGDLVTITSGTEQKTYTVIIYGDTNGDGSITALDLLQVQKNILGYTKLTGAYQKAADTNKDGKITALDLLQVQKDILGYANIKQS